MECPDIARSFRRAPEARPGHSQRHVDADRRRCDSLLVYASRGPPEMGPSEHFSIGLKYSRCGGELCCNVHHFGDARKPLTVSGFLGVFRFAKMAPIGPRASHLSGSKNASIDAMHECA